MSQWKDFVDEYGVPRSIFNRTAHVGGERYDITKMSLEEMKKYSFRGTHPLSDLESGLLRQATDPCVLELSYEIS